jgi:hypothetical protein
VIAFAPNQPVRENRNVPNPKSGHVIGEPTNDGCDYEVEWRDGKRATVDRTAIVPDTGEAV